jgi:prepilin-type processing-associated H-X9-DG protein
VCACPCGHRDYIDPAYYCQYPANHELTRYGAPRVMDVRQPARVFMLLDGGHAFLDYRAVTDPRSLNGLSLPTCYIRGTACGRNPEDFGFEGWAAKDVVEGRHNGGVNVTFADRHTKWLAGGSLMGHPEYWEAY